MNYSNTNSLLLLVQWILLAIPLPGYIHPDEYFQSTEVMARDVLNLKAHKTWEWSQSQPSRNVVFPVVVAGIPFWILNKLSLYFNFEMSTVMLLLSPRIMMGLLSFTMDNILNRICCSLKLSRQNSGLATFLFRSSHVTIVFLTRTFSNNAEQLLFAVILLCIFKRNSCKFVWTLDFILGVLIGIGFFIRQSILGFAIYPMTQIGTSLLFSCKNVKMLKPVFSYITMVLLGIGFSSAFCIGLDCVYFSTTCNLDGILITPLNLIKYNSNIENLKLHGIHPRFLHATVNMFMLFGPLYVVLIFQVISSFKNTSLRSLFMFASSKNIGGYLLMAVITPLAVLSVVPHQEPRFILPLLILLCCYAAHHGRIFHSKKFKLCWVLFNLFGIAWFGFLHQGGENTFWHNLKTIIESH